MGSIPTSYLAGRWLRGIDIRQYGSGNVGASNVYHNVGHWVVVPVGVFDIAKSAIPTLLALYVLDMGYGVAVATGLCSTIGHSWSIFLGFTGGRGLATNLGFLLVVFPEGVALMAVVLFIGWVFGAFWTTSLGYLLLPFLSVILDKPLAVTWGCIAIITITAIKRLEANRSPLPDGRSRWRVVARRLWLDRDIRAHNRWVSRESGENETVATIDEHRTNGE